MSGRENGRPHEMVHHLIGEKYYRRDIIGDGTYGTVYEGSRAKDSLKVALKKIKLVTTQFPITTLREIRILKEFDHRNLVGLLEVVSSDEGSSTPTIYLVFEYMDFDLAMLISSKVDWFRESVIKYLFIQLLEGVHYLHKHDILHRDIKAANILINSKGVLKLADFGLARPMSYTLGRSNVYTNEVITSWYRPLEIFYGEIEYGPEVDIWSCGCIFGELLNQKPMFSADNDIEQTRIIYDKLGTPDPRVWTNLNDTEQYPLYIAPKTKKSVNIRNTLPDRDYASNWTNGAFDLISRMLCLEPNDRMSNALEALESHYLTEEAPRPTKKEVYIDGSKINKRKIRNPQPKTSTPELPMPPPVKKQKIDELPPPNPIQRPGPPSKPPQLPKKQNKPPPRPPSYKP